MNLKIEKQAHQVTQARVKADNEFEKLIALKHEYLKLKQGLAVPYVTNTAEFMVLPQSEALADEATKAELSELLAQEQCVQANRICLAHNIA